MHTANEPNSVIYIVRRCVGTMWNEILVDAKHLNIDKIVQEQHLPWAIHESMGCMPIRQHDVPSNCDHRRPMWHRRNLHRRANSRMPMWCYSGNYSIVDKNAVCQPFCFVLMISFVPARIISLQFFLCYKFCKEKRKEKIKISYNKARNEKKRRINKVERISINYNHFEV